MHIIIVIFINDIPNLKLNMDLKYDRNSHNLFIFKIFIFMLLYKKKSNFQVPEYNLCRNITRENEVGLI